MEYLCCALRPLFFYVCENLAALETLSALLPRLKASATGKIPEIRLRDAESRMHCAGAAWDHLLFLKKGESVVFPVVLSRHSSPHVSSSFATFALPSQSDLLTICALQPSRSSASSPPRTPKPHRFVTNCKSLELPPHQSLSMCGLPWTGAYWEAEPQTAQLVHEWYETHARLPES